VRYSYIRQLFREELMVSRNFRKLAWEAPDHKDAEMAANFFMIICVVVLGPIALVIAGIKWACRPITG
jgi:hypothetical protein